MGGHVKVTTPLSQPYLHIHMESSKFGGRLILCNLRYFLGDGLSDLGHGEFRDITTSPILVLFEEKKKKRERERRKR